MNNLLPSSRILDSPKSKLTLSSRKLWLLYSMLMVIASLFFIASTRAVEYDPSLRVNSASGLLELTLSINFTIFIIALVLGALFAILPFKSLTFYEKWGFTLPIIGSLIQVLWFLPLFVLVLGYIFGS